MTHYALRTSLGYVDSITMTGRVKLAHKLNKEILTENKEFLEELKVVLQKSGNVEGLEVVEITLVENLT